MERTGGSNIADSADELRLRLREQLAALTTVARDHYRKSPNISNHVS